MTGYKYTSPKQAYCCVKVLYALCLLLTIKSTVCCVRNVFFVLARADGAICMCILPEHADNVSIYTERTLPKLVQDNQRISTVCLAQGILPSLFEIGCRRKHGRISYYLGLQLFTNCRDIIYVEACRGSLYMSY